MRVRKRQQVVRARRRDLIIGLVALPVFAGVLMTRGGTPQRTYAEPYEGAPVWSDADPTAEPGQSATKQDESDSDRRPDESLELDDAR